MYPSTGDNLYDESKAHISQVPLEQEHIDFSVQQYRKNNQVVPDRRKEHEQRRRERLSTSEQEHIDFSAPQQHKTYQVVPEQPKENDERRRERLSTWRYHCHVEQAVVTDKRSKLTAAAKLLSAEEMQLLDEDIFNPLDIALIISKNSKTTAGN